MKKLKVMTVVGTRPEIIRLSAVINKLNESEQLTMCLFIQDRTMTMNSMKYSSMIST